MNTVWQIFVASLVGFAPLASGSGTMASIPKDEPVHIVSTSQPSPKAVGRHNETLPLQIPHQRESSQDGTPPLLALPLNSPVAPVLGSFLAETAPILKASRPRSSTGCRSPPKVPSISA